MNTLATMGFFQLCVTIVFGHLCYEHGGALNGIVFGASLVVSTLYLINLVSFQQHKKQEAAAKERTEGFIKSLEAAIASGDVDVHNISEEIEEDGLH